MAPREQKKRKRDETTTSIDTSKPSAVFKPTKGRKHTISVALPGSVVANAVTHDQKTALVGYVARACAVFCVDEIVIFDDGQAPARAPEQGGYTAYSDPNYFFYHLLSYLETPPHLRKALFPMHPDLRTAGALPSLDMPHHLRSDEWCPYREGVTYTSRSGGNQTVVECGLQCEVTIPDSVPENTRVTVKLPDVEGPGLPRTLAATAVSPEMPREEAGYYWGYSIRPASSLSNVFTECPYDGGYDISLGTSERGVDLSSILGPSGESFVEPTWEHLLIVFGGVAGLEVALAADKELRKAGVEEVKDLFDRWVNLVPGQGSRTIRTEEAIWIGLAGLRPLVSARSEA